MNDEQFLLANAYLDGELTDDERALAESDPAVMAAVDDLRALQDVMRDVAPPSDVARRTAITAAMAEFTLGATAAASVSRPSPAPIPFRPRPSYAKYLAVAAGVLGVGLLGVAVVNLDTGGDDDSADMAIEPDAAEPAAEPAEEPAEARVTEDADTFSTEAAGDVTTSDATSEMAAEEPAVAPAEEPAAEEPAEEPADEPASDDGLAERPGLESGQVLSTPEELGSYGTSLVEQLEAGTLPPSPNHACPIANVLGRADLLVADTVVPILVAVDEPAGIVLAFDDTTCDLVAEGPLYLP